MARRWVRQVLTAAFVFMLPAIVWSDAVRSDTVLSDTGNRVDGDDDSTDHVKALEALKSGKIVPITKILDYLDQNFRGSVVEIELEADEVPMIYEVEYLTDEGNFLEFDFDATSGAVRAIKGTGIESARKKP